jgi:hypothetical protein
VDLFTSEDKCWDAGPMVGGKYTAIEVTCPTTGLGDPGEISWNLGPNPVQDQLRFTLPEGYRFQAIYSLPGKEMPIRPDCTEGECRIDFSGYPAGVYYLVLANKDGSRISRNIVKY